MVFWNILILFLFIGDDWYSSVRPYKLLKYVMLLYSISLLPVAFLYLASAWDPLDPLWTQNLKGEHLA